MHYFIDMGILTTNICITAVLATYKFDYNDIFSIDNQV